MTSELCLNVRAGLLDKYTAGITDGSKLPLQSSLGKQPLSVKKSLTGVKFGTSSRDDLTKANDTPGPNAYPPGSTLGRMAATTGATYRRSPPTTKFSMAARDAGDIKSSSPGPNIVLPTTLQKQVFDSTKCSPPGVAFSKSSGPVGGANTNPGPVYAIPSALGSQPLSNSRSSPCVKFGSSSRDAGEIISDTPAASLDGSMFGRRPCTSNSTVRRAPAFSLGTSSRDGGGKPFSHTTPSPKYLLKTTLGASPVSTIRSPPTSKFGTSSRDALYRPSDTPGPGTNERAAVSAIGPQLLSTKRSHAGARFGQSADRGDRPASSTPASNAYGTPSRGIGKMVESTKRNMPAFGFGISRADADRSKGRAKETPASNAYDVPSTLLRHPTLHSGGTVKFGQSSRDVGCASDQKPAPNAYKPATAIGRQVISTRPSSPVATFGVSRSDLDRKNKSSSTPGPDYKITGVMGLQPLSTLKSLPRTKFGSSTRDALYQASSTPGPGSYSDGYRAVVRKQPSFSFGSR